MIKAWRIVTPQYIKNAFDGEGSRLYGGRWNSKGVSVVYTASSLALAAIEILVHLDSDAVLNRYVGIDVEFDFNLVQSLPLNDLPKGWRHRQSLSLTRHLGDH